MVVIMPELTKYSYGSHGLKIRVGCSHFMQDCFKAAKGFCKINTIRLSTANVEYGFVTSCCLFQIPCKLDPGGCHTN